MAVLRLLYCEDTLTLSGVVLFDVSARVYVFSKYCRIKIAMAELSAMFVSSTATLVVYQ
jgi:hypothetical protein